MDNSFRYIEPFNGPIEIGLRALVVLTRAFPRSFSIQQLIAFDYLLVHSDDVPEGPNSLHPKTPQRSGEMLVRRQTLQRGILLFSGRGLILQHYQPDGLRYSASEISGSFLDSLSSQYTTSLRSMAEWVVACFGDMQETELSHFMQSHLGEWGAEFTMESVLWQEESK